MLNLTNPAAPTLGSLTTIPGAAGHGAQSVAVAPDGNHVAVAVGDVLYFYSGLLNAAAGSPLTPSAPPITFPNLVYSLNYTASGNLTVNYENLTGTTGYWPPSPTPSRRRRRRATPSCCRASHRTPTAPRCCRQRRP